MSHPCPIKIEAMEKPGEFVRAAPKNEDTKWQPFTGAAQKAPLDNDPPTLSDLGVSKNEDATAQCPATVAQEKPQESQQPVRS